MALFNNSADSAGSNTAPTSTSSSADNSAEGSTASIEGESAPEPDIPLLYVISHDNDTVTDLKNAEVAHEQDDDYSDAEEVENRGDPARSPYRIGRSLASSTTTITALEGGGVGSRLSIAVNDNSLRIPRERSYGNDLADGDDDGNEEDIEDGDEYDEADDLYDQLFDTQDPISRKAALATASALFAKQVGSSGGKDDIEMDEVERSFLRCTKPICSKKELISCLSSRSTSPGPISPLLSDEDFPSLCSATSGSCSTAPSSRRSSDGSHTPKVRFKKGCVITAVNLTWAPTTYDRAPIDVAESLDMHRCQNVEDAEGYAQDDDSALAIHDQVAAALVNPVTARGEWQAFAPGIYNPDDLSVAEAVPRAPPSPPAPSSPATSAQVKYAYAASFGSTIRRIASPEESPSSSDYQSGFSFSRSTVGYPLSRQSCFESTSSSSSSSESECDDIIERCRGLHDLHQNPVQVQALKTSPRQVQPSPYRPTARSPIRHSLVSSTATVETSLGAAARELSDSLDESSRSSSPSLSRHTSDNEDCLSSTPRAGTGNFMSRRAEYLPVTSSSSSLPESSKVIHGFALCPTRQADFEANGTHDTSPPPQEEQPARKVQRRLERRASSTCSLSRFRTSGDIWESCEALGGF